MSDATTVTDAPNPSTPPIEPMPRRARSHVGRLVMLVIALGVAGVGFYARANVAPGGAVTAIKLTTKPDIAGQARDAYDSIVPTTADLYLVVKSPGGGGAERTQVFKDTPIGSGLTWTLSPSRDLTAIELIEVWDRRRLIGDKQLDRVAFPPDAWVARGQTFELTALGTPHAPPPWALPVACAGATLAGLLLLRLVWDQAV